MTRSRRAGATLTFVLLAASLAVPASTVAAAPVAGAQPASTREDVATTVTLVGIDGDGDATAFELTTPPLLGTLGELGAPDCDGQIPQTCTVEVQYTPSPNANGLDAFGFSVSDGATTVPSTANVAVTSVNDAPVFSAGPDQVVLEDIGPRSIPGWATAISAGPSDEAGQALTFVVAAADPSLFSAQPAVSASGALTFTPAADANGSTSVSATLHDGGGTGNGGVDASGSQSFSVSIGPVNDPPSFSIGPGQVVAEDSGARTVGSWATAISAGPADEVGQSVAFAVVGDTNPALFAVGPAVSPTGSLSFTPAANANGTATVTIALSDDGGTASGGDDTSDALSFSIQVTAVNDPPHAVDDTVSVDEDSGVTVLALIANDDDGPDAGETIAIVSVSGPSHGAASLTGGVARYTTAQDYAGADDFTYTISDGHGGTDSATVHLTVDAVNDPPTADPDAYSVSEDSTLTRAAAQGVLAGDADVDAGTTLTAVLVGDVSHGTLNLAPNGSFTYTPTHDYVGSDTFTYRASDGVAQSAVATVSLTVTGVNDQPSFTKGAGQVVLEDSGARTVAGWASAIVAGPPNESGQVVTFQVVGNTNPGLFSAGPAVASNGTLTFAPAANANGSATITVRAHDDGGTAEGGDDTSPNQTFTIAVTSVNDAPSFTKGATQVVLEDGGSRTVSGWATSISRGPADEAGQGLAFHVSTTNFGLFSAGPAIDTSGTLTFTLAANANGSATVSVSLQDDGGTANGGADTSTPKTATITVTAVNDAPSFTKGANQTVAEDSGLRTVTGWATAIVEGPANEAAQTRAFSVTTTNAALFVGAPALSSSGTLTFTPAANRSGSAIITVSLKDSGGTTNGGVDTSTPKTATVTVTSVNDPPTASNDLAEVEAGSGATSIAVLANDSASPDTGETLSVDAITDPPSNGTATIDADDAGLAYKPAVGFSGVDTFTYRLSDGHGGTDTATVRVTVTADVTDPTVTAPKATIVSGVTAGTSTITVRQSWTASDGSGLASTGLARSKDGAPFATVSLPTPTAVKADQDLAFGPTYRYRARATDPAGNVSAWSTGLAMFLRRYQDDSPSITYAGGTWSTRSVADAMGGTVRFATTAGASASLTLTGRAAALIVQREKTSGSVEVWVDGVKAATIDLGVTSPKARQVVWSKAWTTNASRTIKLVVVGDGRVDIDAVVALRDPS